VGGRNNENQSREKIHRSFGKPLYLYQDCGISGLRFMPAIGCANWHANCFEKIRKEQPNENQDESESWQQHLPRVYVRNRFHHQVGRVGETGDDDASIEEELQSVTRLIPACCGDDSHVAI
jgi:hypothetical protein